MAKGKLSKYVAIKKKTLPPETCRFYYMYSLRLTTVVNNELRVLSRARKKTSTN